MKNHFITRSVPYKIILNLLTLFIGAYTVQAQSITWSIVNAAGFEDGADGSFRWTIGEPLTLEIQGTDGSMRVGFLPFAFLEEEITATVSANKEEPEIFLSPNPAHNELRVEVPQDAPQEIRIISLDGQSFLSTHITSVAHLDIRSWPAGPYILYAIDPSGSHQSKTFIKF